MTPPLDPNPAPDPEPHQTPVPEVDDLDLAASAVIDGVASHLGDSAHEVASQSPETLEARVAQLRPVVAALGHPIQQPDTRVRDEQVQRALSTARAGGVGPEHPAVASAPSRPGGPPLRRWLGVAAAIAVLVVGALALARLASTHGSRAQTASRAQAAAGSTTAPAAQPNAAASGAAPAGPPRVDRLPDLGTAADANALVALVRRHQANSRTGLPSNPPSTVAATGANATSGAGADENGSACVTSVRAEHRDLGPTDLVARASLAGQTVEVLVFGPGSTPARGARVLAVRPSDCQVLVDRPA